MFFNTETEDTAKDRLAEAIRVLDQCLHEADQAIRHEAEADQLNEETRIRTKIRTEREIEREDQADRIATVLRGKAEAEVEAEAIREDRDPAKAEVPLTPSLPIPLQSKTQTILSSLLEAHITAEAEALQRSKPHQDSYHTIYSSLKN